jgi:hypothetical protein
MYQKRPPAQFHVQVCQTLPCAMMGCVQDHSRTWRPSSGIKAGRKDDRTGVSNSPPSSASPLRDGAGDAGETRRITRILTEAEIDRLIEGVQQVMERVLTKNFELPESHTPAGV